MGLNASLSLTRRRSLGSAPYGLWRMNASGGTVLRGGVLGSTSGVVHALNDPAEGGLSFPQSWADRVVQTDDAKRDAAASRSRDRGSKTSNLSMYWSPVWKEATAMGLEVKDPRKGLSSAGCAPEIDKISDDESPGVGDAAYLNSRLVSVSRKREENEQDSDAAPIRHKIPQDKTFDRSPFKERIDYRRVAFVPDDERLRPCERLKGSDDFSRVLRAGGTLAYRGTYLNIKAARMPTTWGGKIALDERGRRPRCRLGVISSKKKMSRAVDRARFRRVVRAAFRTNKVLLPVDVDLVVSPAGSNAHECTLQTAIAELLTFNTFFREGKLIRKDRSQDNGRGRGHANRRCGKQ